MICTNFNPDSDFVSKKSRDFPLNSPQIANMTAVIFHRIVQSSDFLVENLLIFRHQSGGTVGQYYHLLTTTF